MAVDFTNSSSDRVGFACIDLDRVVTELEQEAEHDEGRHYLRDEFNDIDRAVTRLQALLVRVAYRQQAAE